MRGIIIIITGFIFTVSCFFLVPYLKCAEIPEPDPEALWSYITKVSPYEKWSFWPEHQGMQPGRAPHGPLHKVYVNDRALNSVKPVAQYGSIIVKENYSKEKVLNALTVMYKIHDYNPTDGDWFWAKYTPQGKAKPFGKPAGCIGCHGTRANNDFILLHDLK
jgi:hypothetical protein